MAKPELVSESRTDRRWTGEWVWHSPREWMDNFHLLARRVFSIDPDATATCRISCNSIYELWINGKQVGRGPNPSLPGFLYFDEFDLSAFLVAGPNVIAVRCYNFGPTMQSTLGQNPGPGGLQVEIESGGRCVVSTDSTWKVLQDPSRRQRTEPISGHRGGFKEECDGRAEVLGWKTLQFDDSAWTNAHGVGRVDESPLGLPIPSEIPPLRIQTVAPVEAYFHTCGQSYGGSKYDVTRPDAVLSNDDTFAIIAPLRTDFSPSLLLDFGRGVYGRFEVDFVDGGDDGAVMEVSYGESLNLTLVDRYTLRPGSQSYAAFERRGGRYVQLTFRNCTAPVRVRRVVCHTQSYPVESRGAFACSDPQLNHIWKVARDTSLANMQDHFEDAPWREQTLYTGDLVNSALFSYYAWGVEPLARKCLRQCARIQDADGLIPLFGPALRPGFVLPEYPAHWIISLWQHHLHWDTPDLLTELWPALERCLGWYERHSDERGFFVRTKGEPWNSFVDNLSNFTAIDQLAAENILICHAIRCASRIAGILGKPAEQQRLARRAELLATNIEAAYWSNEKECLIDSLSPGGDGVTQITNGLALLFDIVSPLRRPSLVTVLRQRTKAPPIRAGNMAYYATEALAHCGMFQAAIHRIREYWGGMLDHGATQYWEVYDPESPEGSIPQRLWSLSHAFCAGPLYSLPARFGGVRAIEPGFRRVLVSPRLAGLDWLMTTVPTPRGDVSVTCLAAVGAGGSQQVDVSTPANVSVDVLLETPARDTWHVAINGAELPIDHDGRPTEPQILRGLHRQLVSATLVEQCVLIRFSASDSPLRVRFTLSPTVGLAGRRIVVAEPAGNWDAAPKPVLKPAS